MCEIIAGHYCPKCEKITSHMFSGSGTKGSCDECGNHLPPEVKCDWKMVIAHPYEENELMQQEEF